jgi:hypothetical protein
MILFHTTRKIAICTRPQPSFVLGIESVQNIWYKGGGTFVPGKILGTKVFGLPEPSFPLLSLFFFLFFFIISSHVISSIFA